MPTVEVYFTQHRVIKVSLKVFKVVVEEVGFDYYLQREISPRIVSWIKNSQWLKKLHVLMFTEKMKKFTKLRSVPEYSYSFYCRLYTSYSAIYVVS